MGNKGNKLPMTQFGLDGMPINIEEAKLLQMRIDSEPNEIDLYDDDEVDKEQFKQTLKNMYELVDKWKMDTLEVYDSMRLIFNYELEKLENQTKVLGQVINMFVCAAAVYSNFPVSMLDLRRIVISSEEVYMILLKNGSGILSSVNYISKCIFPEETKKSFKDMVIDMNKELRRLFSNPTKEEIKLLLPWTSINLDNLKLFDELRNKMVDRTKCVICALLYYESPLLFCDSHTAGFELFYYRWGIGTYAGEKYKRLLIDWIKYDEQLFWKYGKKGGKEMTEWKGVNVYYQEGSNLIIK
jgi:hypothetical protein